MKEYTHTEKDRRGVPVTFNSPTFEGLVDAVVEARRATGKRVDYNRVFNELKLKNANRTRSLPKARNLKLSEAASGARAALSNIKGEIVGQAEIDRRAQICLKCPLVTRSSDCPVCGKGAAITNAFNDAKKFFGGKSYEIPSGLKRTYCDVCGCAHSMILPAKLDAFHEDDEAKAAKRPSFCWIKPTQ